MSLLILDGISLWFIFWLHIFKQFGFSPELYASLINSTRAIAEAMAAGIHLEV
jgi:hypothetical protein